MRERDVRAWLADNYNISAEETECIMAQDEWKFIEARAEQFAGAQWETGPEAVAAGNEFALSALVECHDGPHLPTCPYAPKTDEPTYDTRLDPISPNFDPSSWLKPGSPWADFES